MTNKELAPVLEVLSSFPCTNLEIPNIKKVLALHKKVKNTFEEYKGIRDKIFESKSITNDEEFAAHPEFVLISNQIRNLDDEEVELGETKFLTEEEVLTSAKGMKGITTIGINILLDILAK